MSNKQVTTVSRKSSHVTNDSQRNQRQRLRRCSTAPAPPPPPPEPPSPPPIKSDTLKSTKSIMSTGGSLHDELKLVLPQIQQRRNKLDIKKTPDIFIDQKSNPDEVVEWLEAKGFSNAAQRQLRMSDTSYSRCPDLSWRGHWARMRGNDLQDDLGIRASEHPEESTRESRSLMMEYLPGIDEDASYC
uniref:SAM domain-containing protein n=1 Tax=Bombyx mori TaxID=7091 RepID=A0A8R2RAD4_BOMMO|nr:uncharacterized protein LOC119630873 [Bombyx mori]